MTFDLRLAIGLLLLACGLVLVLHGLVVGTLVLGVNVNLWWGAVVSLFGGAMTFFGAKATRPPKLAAEARKRERTRRSSSA